MIEKENNRTDYKLEARLNAKHKRKANTTSAKLRKMKRDRQRALAIARFGGHQPGMYHAAIAAAGEELNLGRATLAKIWSNFKKHKRDRIVYNTWVTELSKQHGGFNAVVDMQDAGELPNRPPDDYLVDDLEEKLNAEIDRNIETNHWLL